MAGNSVSFSPYASARAKFVLVGAPGDLGNQIVSFFCSLQHFEYVNVKPGRKTGGGARTSSRQSSGDQTLHDMRHWFFGRKRTRGFLLRGFPHDTRQARVFDEWLETRDETLSGCVWIDLGYEDALAQAADRVVCPEHQTVGYAHGGESRKCVQCGAPMASDRERAEREVEWWFEHQAEPTAATAGYYEEQGQLFRFDAATSCVEDVARFAAGMAADR